jgi:hypothetical protein
MLLGEDEPLGPHRSFAPAAGAAASAALCSTGARLPRRPSTIVQRTPPLFTSNHAFLFPPTST